MQRLEWFIARRYLLSKRKVRFINVIGMISIVGITLGVAALLVALSVFNGFGSVVTSVLVGFDPHLRVEKRGGLSTDDTKMIEETLQANTEVQSFAPFVSGKAMLVAGSFNRVVYIRGIDEERVVNVTGLAERMVLGKLNLKDSADVPGIVIGLALADRLASVVSYEIVAISPYGLQTAFRGTGIPETQRFRITGIFESNNRDYDGNYAFISIPAAQALFNVPNTVHGIEIRLKDFHSAEDVKERLRSKLPSEITVSSWYDLHKTLYTVMKVERWSAYILLSLIVMVATFNMLGSLTMGVIEKQRDIAVLKAMGMSSNSLTRLFMFEGILIGIVGTFLGIILGLIVLYLQVEYQIFPLDTSVYIIPAIPVEIEWTDFVAIAIASLGLSYLAAYYPARRAAATLPAQALRWE